MQKALPPAQIESPAAWYGSELTHQQKHWLVHLKSAQIEEIEAAAEHFIKSEKSPATMKSEDFPLPRTQSLLKELLNTLKHGIGFQLIRGLPVKEYSLDTAVVIFCGIGTHLGRARSQNAMGHVLGHVYDLGADINDPEARIYQTSARQTFHTDSTDVVGLMCLRGAMQGGESMLVSTVTIYNEMRKRYPELVPFLFEPVATDRRGEVPHGQQPFFTVPILNWYHQLLTGIYHRRYVDSASRFADAPKLGAGNIAAMDCFDALANDPSLHLCMDFQPGDMQFVYNHTLLHDRKSYRDSVNPAERRHLLRLWLSLPDDRPLPDCFAQRYGSVEIGDRGGIITTGTALNVPMRPAQD
jgi:hypothetical protein